MKQTRIALVQMNAKFGDLAGNLKKIEAFAKQAATQKVDIICFPELCLQGYSRSGSAPLAQPIPGPLANKIIALAQKYQLVMMVGLAEKSTSDKPYITQLVAYPDGNWDKYRKTHLGLSEIPYFTPGQNLPVFKHQLANLGVLICWDLHFPEATTVLSLKGAEIVFVPHASPVIVGDRRSIWLKYMPARAYDNTVFLATCNLVGDDGAGGNFCGGAMVFDPKGNLLGELFSDQDQMLVVDLKPDLINTIRQQKSRSMRFNFSLSQRRPELYADLIHSCHISNGK